MTFFPSKVIRITSYNEERSFTSVRATVPFAVSKSFLNGELFQEDYP
ncbi:MAG: hypothetical protein QXL14_02430 [Candidatus Aenigmatarchaeota archaeon]